MDETFTPEERARIGGEVRRLLREEAAAVEKLQDFIDDTFFAAVEICHTCSGRVVVTGVGKSGLIGRKISSTLASVGTPSFPLHPVEAMHGDLGMVCDGDVILAISHSGAGDELCQLLTSIDRDKVKVIGITSRPNSRLGQLCDVVLNLGVEKEACPLGLAPTTSAIATLAIGDALATALMLKSNFQQSDFAQFHPAGALGRKLTMRIGSIMYAGEHNPVVKRDDTIRRAIIEISSKTLGATSVVDQDGRLLGILTDGDLRRYLERGVIDLESSVYDICTKNPVRIREDALAAQALVMMEERKSQISVLPVVDDQDRSVGMIRVHDLVRIGMGG